MSVFLQLLTQHSPKMSPQSFHNFIAFLSSSESASTSHQRISSNDNFLINAPQTHHWQISRREVYFSLIFILLICVKEREEPSSTRNWVIMIVFGGECPPPWSTCTAPHIHASSTNISGCLVGSRPEATAGGGVMGRKMCFVCTDHWEWGKNS